MAALVLDQSGRGGRATSSALSLTYSSMHCRGPDADCSFPFQQPREYFNRAESMFSIHSVKVAHTKYRNSFIRMYNARKRMRAR